VSGFARLHPAVQHHIVNSLGWRSLRPLQDEAIAPVLAQLPSSVQSGDYTDIRSM